MKFILIAVSVFFAFSNLAFAQDAKAWRKMSETELKGVVPERAPVLKENIETEFRTAAGITDGRNNIFGVTIITAGYEADGKYTHFLKTDQVLRMPELKLAAGEYVFGYKRIDNETLRVTFYNAKTGDEVGKVKAKVEPKKGAIYSFLIDPPTDGAGKIYIGRFVFDYTLGKSLTK